MTDQPATPAHYCPACRTTTPAPAATAERLVQAGVDHQAGCTGPADLRRGLAAAQQQRAEARAAELAAGRGPCNIITSRGRVATQSVFHLHLHLVPRAVNDGLALPWYSGKHSRRPL